LTPHEFVGLWKAEKGSLLAEYFNTGSDTTVAAKIAELALNSEQFVILRDAIDDVLTDAFYTWLLGLDGCAAIGNRQVDYQLADVDGNLLTVSGEIEAEALEAFHGKAGE
jgi:capsid portal protein